MKTIYNGGIMAIFIVSVMQCKKLWFTDNFSIKKKIQKIWTFNYLWLRFFFSSEYFCFEINVSPKIRFPLLFFFSSSISNLARKKIGARHQFHFARWRKKIYFLQHCSNNKARLKIICSHTLKTYIIIPGSKFHVSFKTAAKSPWGEISFPHGWLHCWEKSHVWQWTN